MRISGYVANNYVVFNAVDGFLLLGAEGGVREELLAAGNVGKADGMIFGMDVLFHGIEKDA